ncbi:MAG: hypothetical protein ABI609_00450 [Acidobacteriota bacterium]
MAAAESAPVLECSAHLQCPEAVHQRRARGRWLPSDLDVCVALLILGLLAPHASDAQACECGKQLSIADGLSQADAVFVGRVVDLWPVGVKGNHQIIPGLRVSFRVKERFKGDPATAAVTVLGPCAFRFERDQSYLVFAERDFTGDLSAPTCLPTVDLCGLPLSGETRRALGAPLAATFEPPDRPGPPESRGHRMARRAALVGIMSRIQLSDTWDRWAGSEHGPETQLAAGVTLGGVLGWLLVQLRRRRFTRVAWLALGTPGLLALGFFVWMS